MTSRFDSAQGDYILKGLDRHSNACAKCHHIKYYGESYDHVAIDVPRVEFDVFGREGERDVRPFCPACAAQMLGKSEERLLKEAARLQVKRDAEARKNAAAYRKAQLAASDMPESVVVAFENLAVGQRGRPEEAMMDATKYFPAGQIAYLLEHVGDLTHRMAQSPLFFKGGMEWVLEKVPPALRRLRREDFASEHAEDIRAYAQKKSIPIRTYRQKLDTLLSKYADEHAKLKVYNEAQYCAREAAIAVGREDFTRAERMLTRLEEMLAEGEAGWERHAMTFRVDDAGNPMEYPYHSTSRFGS